MFSLFSLVLTSDILQKSAQSLRLLAEWGFPRLGCVHTEKATLENLGALGLRRVSLTKSRVTLAKVLKLHFLTEGLDKAQHFTFFEETSTLTECLKQDRWRTHHWRSPKYPRQIRPAQWGWCRILCCFSPFQVELLPGGESGNVLL